MTLIKKLKLKEPARILRKQELKYHWSTQRLELKEEAKKYYEMKKLSKILKKGYRHKEIERASKTNHL
ncbi:hypothetical protein EEL31_18975 [Brevibacillus laterosporus]|nr:hypothetical protein EEL31_18975 [Brevibacillus laterosporus]